MTMIRATHLSKHFQVAQPGEGLSEKLKRFFAPQYKLIKAVDDVSLEIERGSIVGYLGPNGAGKSTTIKLLTGILTPSAGDVLVNGLVPHKARTQNAFNIGVVFGQRSQLWWDLPLIDSFHILRAMYRVPQERYRRNLAFLVELLEMADFLEQPVRKLSLGQKMKGDITAALLHDPPILYLDEPTIGLDVISKNKILQFLRALNAERQTTIILTTHNLSDVEQVCPRIVIIDKGKIILDAMQSEIFQRFGKQRVLTVEFHDRVPAIQAPAGKIIEQSENKVCIEFNREEISAFDLMAALGKDWPIKDVSIHEENIESIVSRIYQTGVGTD